MLKCKRKEELCNSDFNLNALHNSTNLDSIKQIYFNLRIGSISMNNLIPLIATVCFIIILIVGCKFSYDYGYKYTQSRRVKHQHVGCACCH